MPRRMWQAIRGGRAGSPTSRYHPIRFDSLGKSGPHRYAGPQVLSSSGSLGSVSAVKPQARMICFLPILLKRSTARGGESDGYRIRPESDLSRRFQSGARSAMRVCRYRLVDEPGSWLILICPGCDREEARQSVAVNSGQSGCWRWWSTEPASLAGAPTVRAPSGSLPNRDGGQHSSGTRN